MAPMKGKLLSQTDHFFLEPAKVGRKPGKLKEEIVCGEILSTRCSWLRDSAQCATTFFLQLSSPQKFSV
ncbi:hypothetical protein AAC387_Pa12g1212 [Persea americana]